MKRLSMAMTALAVMGLMTMVSCRKPNVNNVVPGAARTVTFNAATESGNGSKTTLDGLDVNWSAGDQISVNGNDNKLTLEGDGGSTFGRFTGTITATAPYLVGYPATATNDGTNITFTISDNQDGDADFDSKLPMAAYTTNENGDLSFRNMANVLKLDLTGTQSLTKIEVESADEFLSGSFTVGTDLTATHVSTGDMTKKITINYATPLTLSGDPENPTEVYVVLPVFGSAESTVTVKFTGASGEMTVGPKALTGSTTPNNRYTAAVAVSLAAPVETDLWINFNDEAMGVTGLPIWSKKNLGATCSTENPTDPKTATTWYGGYYAWGEVETYYTSINWTAYDDGSAAGWKTGKTDGYDLGSYRWYNGSEETLTKYNTKSTYGTVDNKTTLEDADDAAYQNAIPANTWRMPTGGEDGEWQLLASNTYFKWEYGYNGIAGLNGFVVYKVKDSADKGLMTLDENYDPDEPSWATYNQYWEEASVQGDYSASDPHMFLPAAGYFDGTSLYFAGSYGYYWSSSLGSDFPDSAWSMGFYSGDVYPQSYDYRYFGFTVRPVQ